MNMKELDILKSTLKVFVIFFHRNAQAIHAKMAANVLTKSIPSAALVKAGSPESAAKRRPMDARKTLATTAYARKLHTDINAHVIKDMEVLGAILKSMNVLVLLVRMVDFV